MKTFALDAGKSALSSQTGFVHIGDTIPLYENFSFILSLFRTHQAEEIELGKTLLKRLLAFQVSSGAFPHALHNYPEPASFEYSLLCALPLHWIFKKYQHVIEPNLREKLKQALDNALHVSHEKLSPVYQALLNAFQGKEISPFPVRSSSEWGMLLLAYQLANEEPTWILKGALHAWDSKLMAYVGPSIDEYQRFFYPEVNLYDLFMAVYTNQMSKRLEEKHLIHLQASLIFPFEKRLDAEPIVYSNNIRFLSKGFHQIRLLWGDANQIYSFACQENSHAFEERDGLSLFTYPTEIPNEKERMELAFYCSYLPELSLFAGGEKTTVFELNDLIEIKTPDRILTLQFALEEGEGHFLGHISRGNRPSQIGLNGPKDFTSYDWKIGLRTIDRTSNCKISLKIS